MPNGRCKMHGGKSTGAPKGAAHPAYKHGRRTQEAVAERRETRDILKTVGELIKAAGSSSQ
jgi:hypothetical protein